MPSLWRRLVDRKALAADRKFLAAMEEIAFDRAQMSRLSPDRRDYVRVMIRAMRWWLREGYPKYGIDPPGRGDLPPRDRILGLYLDEHSEEDKKAAARGQAAQAASMRRYRPN